MCGVYLASFAVGDSLCPGLCILALTYFYKDDVREVPTLEDPQRSIAPTLRKDVHWDDESEEGTNEQSALVAHAAAVPRKMRGMIITCAMLADFGQQMLIYGDSLWLFAPIDYVFRCDWRSPIGICVTEQ